jgi:hypothetical protein
VVSYLGIEAFVRDFGRTYSTKRISLLLNVWVVKPKAEGATEADLLDSYPPLNESDIKAALAYAADTFVVLEPHQARFNRNRLVENK